ncbi:MAG: hypothetical protein Q4D51_05205 [Eubacteriales bacterium]|nr:hypothetical protein [Eubacteriales bacterium]
MNKSSIKDLLQIAISPIGTTMYVWGGGWNEADLAAGPEAMRKGLSPSWEKFASMQDATYDYHQFRHQIHDGLDCSGFVGWVVYNTFHTENEEKNYVFRASRQAEHFSNMGFGTYYLAHQVTDYKAGDIMSSTCGCCSHVWIVVGSCLDGSIVLVHSSPPGVQLCGTVTPDGKKNSQAYRLAKKYMKKINRDWYRKYPNVSRDIRYLSHYAQMRWFIGWDGVLTDYEGYREMHADQILKDLIR